MGAPLGGDGAPQPSVPFAWGAARIPCTHTQRRCPGGLVGRGRVLLGARLCRRPYVWVGPPGGGGWRPLRSDAAAGGDRCAATRRNGTAPPCRSVVAAAIPRSSDGALPLPLPPPAPTTRAHGITARTASPPRRSRRWPRRRPSGGGRVASSTCCSRCAPSGGHALSADGTAGMLRRGVGSAAMAPPRPHWRRPSGGGGRGGAVWRCRGGLPLLVRCRHGCAPPVCASRRRMVGRFSCLCLDPQTVCPARHLRCQRCARAAAPWCPKADPCKWRRRGRQPLSRLGGSFLTTPIEAWAEGRACAQPPHRRHRYGRMPALQATK